MLITCCLSFFQLFDRLFCFSKTYGFIFFDKLDKTFGEVVTQRDIHHIGTLRIVQCRVELVCVLEHRLRARLEVRNKKMMIRMFLAATRTFIVIVALNDHFHGVFCTRTVNGALSLSVKRMK